jgi:hypothetical protein
MVAASNLPTNLRPLLPCRAFYLRTFQDAFQAPAGMPRGVASLLERLLAKAPEDRPTAQEALVMIQAAVSRPEQIVAPTAPRAAPLNATWQVPTNPEAQLQPLRSTNQRLDMLVQPAVTMKAALLRLPGVSAFDDAKLGRLAETHTKVQMAPRPACLHSVTSPCGCAETAVHVQHSGIPDRIRLPCSRLSSEGMAVRNSSCSCTQVLAYLADALCRTGYACTGLGVMGPVEAKEVVLHILEHCPELFDQQAVKHLMAVSGGGLTATLLHVPVDDIKYCSCLLHVLSVDVGCATQACMVCHEELAPVHPWR